MMMFANNHVHFFLPEQAVLSFLLACFIKLARIYIIMAIKMIRIDILVLFQIQDYQHFTTHIAYRFLELSVSGSPFVF
jgi:hypothetical protein